MSQLLSEKFKYLIEYKSGYTWSKDQENIKKEDGSIRVLTVTNVQKTLDLRSKLYLTKVSENDKIEKAVSKDWTIAVSSNGNRSRIGNAIFVENDSEYLFASFLTAFKPKVDFLDPKYFYYWFSSDYVQQSISSVAEGSTGLSNLDIRYLRNMDIKYHNSSDEQKAIATILSKVDEAIESTKQTINSAQKLKTSLMQNLLTGKIKPDGTKRKDDEFYYDEKLGKVPKGWDVKPLKNICDLRGESFDPLKHNEIFKYIGLEHIESGEFRINGYGLSNDTVSTKSKFYENDILYGKLRPYLNKVYKAEFEGVCSTECLVLVSEIYANWISLNLQQKRFLDFTQSMTAGTQHPRAGWKDIKKYLVMVPENDEMIKIENAINHFQELRITKNKKIAKLEKLKKSLMQNLLTGKMRLDKKLIKELISHV